MPDRSVLPGLLTLAGALCALWASILLIRDGSAATEAAVLWWWLAVICDQLDGPLARALGATSPRGALLDGLSDSVLYLLAPAAICLVSDAPLAGLAAFALGLWRLSGDLTRDTKGVHFGLPAVVLVTGQAVLGWTPLAAWIWAVASGAWFLLVPRAPGWLRIPMGVAAVGTLGVVFSDLSA